MQVVAAKSSGDLAPEVVGVNGNAPSNGSPPPSDAGASVAALSYAIGDVLAMEARNLTSPFCEAYFTERVSFCCFLACHNSTLQPCAKLP